MNETELLMWIADGAGVCGMVYFLWAEIKQLVKIKKTSKVTGISRTAYTSKLKAIGFTSIMLAITALYMSLAVIVAEGLVVIWVLYLMNKYKPSKKWWMI